MYQQNYIITDRLRITYYRAGKKTAPKLLMIHGNLSASVFFLPLFSELSKRYDVVAPDLRCFGKTENLPIDATRGYRDWSDDLFSLVKSLGWKKFAIAGWSMGGNIAMQFAVDHSEMLSHIILIAPGSPFGFGGTRGENGEALYPLGLASGGGCANQQLVAALAVGSIPILREILHQFYFSPVFRMSNEWESLLLEGIASTRVGPGRYPGDSIYVSKWPFVSAGSVGVLNAMTPTHGNLWSFTEILDKPPVLWIRGDKDAIVSDTSMLEFGFLGKIGLVPGWPGDNVIPPQPMIAQTRYVMEHYKHNGGKYKEIVIPGGHLCPLESPNEFLSTINEFLAVP